MTTPTNKIISDDLQTWLSTYLWMKDEQDSGHKSRNPSIKFEELPPEIEAGIRKWFSDITAMLNTSEPPLAVDYKVNLGNRLGCFPVAMDHKAVQILVDNIPRHVNELEFNDIRRLAGL